MIPYPFFMGSCKGSVISSKVDIHYRSNYAKYWTHCTSRNRHRKGFGLEPLSKGEILKREGRNVAFARGGGVILHAVFRN